MPLTASAPSLQHRHVLVVEDDYILAMELKDELERLGAEVLGPVSSVADALALLSSNPAPDMAVLDLNLGGEMVFPLADALEQRAIPFIFLSGYEQWNWGERHAEVPRLEKPVEIQRIARALAGRAPAGVSRVPSMTGGSAPR